jgi:GxxExxY protein
MLNRKDAKAAKKELIEPDETTEQVAKAVIGAAIEVHRNLGSGYLESVYENALAIELEERRIPFQRQHPVAAIYKGRIVGEGKLDFLVDDRLPVELKAVEKTLPIHQAQVISYLKATGCILGLLLNFNAPMMKDGIKRVVFS